MKCGTCQDREADDRGGIPSAHGACCTLCYGTSGITHSAACGMRQAALGDPRFCYVKAAPDAVDPDGSALRRENATHRQVGYFDGLHQRPGKIYYRESAMVAYREGYVSGEADRG